MKRLIKDSYESDHSLEILFSSLRWFFLIVSAVVFTIQYIDNPNTLRLTIFVALIVFGIIYMGISDFYLHKSPQDSVMYRTMTKGGPFFDFIAYSALVPLTGGIDSPLFPLAYLIILHVSVYWKLAGGFISAFLFTLLYTVIYFTQVQGVTLNILIPYSTQIVFFLLMGFLGGIIVSRERKQHSERNLLEVAANRDYLTGLLNHRSFQEHLRTDLESGKDFYLVLSDIDKFKYINDRYGHVTGDKVLCQISGMISSIIPQNQGNCFRYGGEEFAIIFYSIDREKVDKMLVEIKDTIANHLFYYGEESFSVTMSFGSCRQKGEKSDQLVEKVDKLLYEAKDKGRNQIVYSNVG
ncbi:GGDEF domain-containing protein [Evansella sp. AB-rgal1]|uniref:GGDEF domain-containing protein n=1 Tax=Evansella sp. AB-rgal1 TaxID=3242696 RepID=UPI00359DCAD5